MNPSIPLKEGAPGSEARTSDVPWALVSLSLAMLMPSLDTSIANVGLPALARAFGASFQQVQWIILSYLLALTTLVVGAGRLGDLFGRRRLLGLGIAVFTGASLLCGLAPGFWILVGARAVQGLGAAIMVACSLALVGEAVPEARLGQAMGWLGTVSALGTMLGPSLGGLLIARVGWRAIFLANVPLGLLNLALAGRTLPADRARPAAPRAFDGAGTLLLALSLAAYALAMTLGRGHGSWAQVGLLALALVGGGLFARIEARRPSPLIRLERLQSPALRAGLPMNALVSAVMMSTLVVGPFYLSLGLGLDPARVGGVMAVGPLVSSLTGILAGRLVDRLGPAVVGLAGLLELAAGTSALTLLPTAFGVAGYLAAILLLTPGYQLFLAANTTAVMREAPLDQRGVTSSLLSLSRNLGLITGAAVLGAVFALGTGTDALGAASPAAVTAGFQRTFEAATVLILVAGSLAFPRALARHREARARG